MKIIWTRLALDDFNQAYKFISTHNPKLLKNTIQQIDKALESLKNYPYLGKQGRVENTRELVVYQTPFVIPYRTKEDRIEILAFIHGSRQWPDIL